MKKRIIIITIISIVLITLLIVCIPIFAWVKNHRHRFIKEDSDVAGMTLAQVKEKYGDFYYQETYLFTEEYCKSNDQDYQRRDDCYYIISPYQPGFLGAHYAEVLIVHFRDGVATSTKTEVTDELYGNGSDKYRYREFLDWEEVTPTN